MCKLKKRSGQALVEYLLLVALMVVASFGVVKLLNHSVRGKFIQVIDAVQGKKSSGFRFENPNSSEFKKKDMSNFMNGARPAKKE